MDEKRFKKSIHHRFGFLKLCSREAYETAIRDSASIDKMRAMAEAMSEAYAQIVEWCDKMTHAKYMISRNKPLKDYIVKKYNIREEAVNDWWGEKLVAYMTYRDKNPSISTEPGVWESVIYTGDEPILSQEIIDSLLNINPLEA